MIINDIKIDPRNDSLDELKRRVAKQMKIPVNQLPGIRILRRSVDARRKDTVKIIYSVEVNSEFGIQNSELINSFPQTNSKFQTSNSELKKVIVAGSGPAGMLCALTLAQSGARPIVLERGLPAKRRAEAVEAYFSGGQLNPQCNIQFGEGGAGTFSDGKLTTGIRDPRIRTVLETFVRAGAPDEILYQAKPHIGTDILVEMIQNIRKRIESLGGEYRFSAHLVDINFKNDKIKSVIIKSQDIEEELPCDALVLAIGHSARDTFELLYRRGIKMEQKAFAVGARIEHPQEIIDRMQYGSFAGLSSLGAAEYKFATKVFDGNSERSVYTFCMCPGGQVVAAASEPRGIVTNGMSLYARDGKNANSAILVSVGPSDFESNHPLAGVEFQRKIEQSAYRFASDFQFSTFNFQFNKAPAQLLGDFLADRPSESVGSVIPSYRPGVVLGDIGCCLPGYMMNSMREGIKSFGRKVPAFLLEDAVLTAPETRSSSPVRILRDEDMQSNIRGVYPCGEGAGYAGGITSAAVDGIKIAEKILSYG